MVSTRGGVRPGGPLGHDPIQHDGPARRFAQLPRPAAMRAAMAVMAAESEFEISPTSWVRDQTQKILETGTTDGVDIKGSPVVLITMRGAKSGKLRKVPADAGRARRGLRDRGLARRRPEATRSGTTTSSPTRERRAAGRHRDRDYTAREVTGEEKAVWWERAVAAYPDYADYQKRTDRQIPVFVLEPRVG